MRNHASLLSILPVSFLLTAGCGDYLDLEPDDPPPPDAAPSDPGPGYPPLPPPQAFPDQPVVTTPGEAPPPPGDVGEGVRLAFPPPVSLTTARRVTVRGTARLAGGVTAVRVNGVDARLSPPNAQGAVAWQADVQVTRGVSELVVSSVDGNGDATPAASASITFSPDMRVRPGTLAFDAGHDRVLVFDEMQGLVAIDLETGTPTRLHLQENADGPMVLSSLSIDPPTGRAMALFQQQTRGEVSQYVSGIASIDLRDGATVAVQELERCSSDCSPAGEPYVDQRGVVLQAGGERYAYAVNVCSDRDGCAAEIRQRRLYGETPLDDVPLCESPRCLPLHLIADQVGTGLFALVRDGISPRPADTSYEIRAIDPITGTQTTVVTVQTEWNDTRFDPRSLLLDAAGNRLFVLASSVIEGVLSSRPSVIGVDLATGAQSLLLADAAAVDGSDIWGYADALYDPRRERLILTDYDRGLVALDLATGATSLLYRPAIGEGPTPSCRTTRPCDVSNLDPGRQRFFVHVPTSWEEGDLYVMDLTTGDRRLLSPGGSGVEFGTAPRLLADDVEDRLLVVHENRSLYAVDGATGERAFVGTVPVFERGAVAWDPARNRILYLAEQDGGHALRAFDVDTRQDRVISSDTVGSGPPLGPVPGLPVNPTDVLVSLDASGTRAFVSHVDGRALLGVDLVTGDRTSHAMGEPAGRRVEPDWQQRVLADTRRNRVLVAEYPRYAIGAIDLSTGAADVFVDYYRADPPFWLTGDLMPDHAHDRALVADEMQNVYVLDLQTGQSVLVLQSGR